MPPLQRVSGEAFAVERLREDPNLDYATLRQQATASGISMQPIHYGRARRQLGLPVLRDNREAANATPAATPGGPANEEPAGERTDLAAPAVPVPSRRKGSPAFDFIVEELRREPSISYGQVRDRAKARDFSIAPIMYGRAKAILGLVPVRPRGSAKRKQARPAAAEVAPLRLRQTESVAADRFGKQLDEVRNLEQLVMVVKEFDAERRRLRDVLQRIAAMIDETLG